VECGDKVIAYSGDTEWDDTLIEVASDADLLICEAYFFDKRVKYHLDYRSLRARLHDLRCRHLILTHMNEDLLNRLSDVDVECAEDGKSITV
jgi:ribonuclease BN (tRNA processing enzyme)